jgi:hypothetical protein
MLQVILVPASLNSAVGAARFSDLANLSTCAFDLSVGNYADSALVGQAQGAWIPNTGNNAVGAGSQCVRTGSIRPAAARFEFWGYQPRA